MKILDPEYIRKDRRGELVQINSGLWKQINYLTIKKNNSFGGHYHKHKKELFYVTEGFVSVEIVDMKIKQVAKMYFGIGKCFIIEPYEKHTIFAEKDSKLIELLSETYNKDDIWTK
mgnify:CR=1 FL=1